MKVRLLLYIGLLISTSGCASNKLEGIWKQEDQSTVASLVFQPNNKCIFSFVPKGAPDGISATCIYKIENNIVTVFFENKNEADDTMRLRYDERQEVLSEIEDSEVFFDFKFKKRDGL